LAYHDRGAISVYTTIFGGYDYLKPHAWTQLTGAKWICVTDDPELKCEGWEIAVVPKKFEDPRKNAKWYKLNPWDVPGFENVNISIFIDGTFEVFSETFIEWLIIRLFNDMLLFRHPDRNCIYEEAIVSKTIKYYSGKELDVQIKDYSKSMESHWGLWACGLMVRKHSPFIRKLMAEWWDEQMKYTLQDQISFAYVCHKNNFRPTELKEHQYKNDLFRIIPHIKDLPPERQLLYAPAKVAEKVKKTENNDRIHFLNDLIYFMNYESYLNLGLGSGATYFPITCKSKDSIDYKPQSLRTPPIFQMTTDDFFHHFRGRLKYDVIFIDDNHERKQVLTDCKNALDMISDGGCVVLHDTNPPNLRYTMQDLCFNAYQAIVDIWFDDSMKVSVHTVTMPVDVGNGVSVIWKSKKKFPTFPAERKDELLNYGGYAALRESDSEIWITEDELFEKMKAR
jgi:hypothetical protein